MLSSIPIISPVDVQLGDAGPRLIGAPVETAVVQDNTPDYEIHPLGEPLSLNAPPRDPASKALDEMELAAQISEYHDFSWWDERIRIVRAALARASSG